MTYSPSTLSEDSQSLHHKQSLDATDLAHASGIRRKFLEYCLEYPEADECRVYES
jgi:hypothetical protein